MTKDICVACGKDTIPGDNTCWDCQRKVSKCNDCEHSGSIQCLTCDDWKFSRYESGRKHEQSGTS